MTSWMIIGRLNSLSLARQPFFEQSCSGTTGDSIASPAELGHDADTDDVVQETYARAFENLTLFRSESSLATWLTRIRYAR